MENDDSGKGSSDIGFALAARSAHVAAGFDVIPPEDDCAPAARTARRSRTHLRMPGVSAHPAPEDAGGRFARRTPERHVSIGPLFRVHPAASLVPRSSAVDEYR